MRSLSDLFCCVWSPLFDFFFQAEDGIRDRNVTGVQTCALPISVRPLNVPAPITRISTSAGTFSGLTGSRTPRPRGRRSEERRVGKGCSGAGGATQYGAYSVADRMRVVQGKSVEESVEDVLQKRL